MDEFKTLTQSKTFWGAIVALGGGAIGIGHYSLSAADAAQLVDLLTGLASAIGGIVAIIGRVVASKKVVLKAPPAAPLVLLAFGVAVWALWGSLAFAGQAAIPDSPVKKMHRASPRAVAAIQAPLPAPRPAAAAAGTGKGGTLSQREAEANPVLVLQSFALNDLQAALADAQAQTPPDAIAATCYQTLITIVQSPVANPLPAGPGAFQLLQKARDLKNMVANLQSNNGPLASLSTGCAPLVLDVQTTLIRLGILTGAVIGAGSIGLPLPIPLGSNEPHTWLTYQQARDAWRIVARQ
jgi:hypothetical protein